MNTERSSSTQLELQASMPWWAPVGDPVQIGFGLVNNGSQGVWVNGRCAVGHVGSGADISLDVYDIHGRRLTSKRVEVPPPPEEVFVWLEAGQTTYGTMVHDVLWDYELPVGKYEFEMIYRLVDRVPPELAGRHVFTDMIRLFRRPLEVIQWGVAPPPRPTGAQA